MKSSSIMTLCENCIVNLGYKAISYPYPGECKSDPINHSGMVCDAIFFYNIQRENTMEKTLTQAIFENTQKEIEEICQFLQTHHIYYTRTLDGTGNTKFVEVELNALSLDDDACSLMMTIYPSRESPNCIIKFEDKAFL